MARILVVEDDDMVRSMIVRSLAGTTHEVIEARNGKEALGLMAAFVPALVLLDIIMPEMDGFELIPVLRQQNPAVKILACSGGGQIAMNATLRTARLLGANCLLAKPFRLADLHAAIESLLES